MIFYVDGSAHPNPGPGGFGVVGIENDIPQIAYTKQFPRVTNNEMELKAILYVMVKYGNKNGNPPIVYSDSAYAVNCLSSWMFNWQKNGWVKGDKKIPENLELIKAYYDLYQEGYRIDLRRIKGHSGEMGNELADQLATGTITPDKIHQI